MLESGQRQSRCLSQLLLQHHLYIPIVFTSGLKVRDSDKGNLLTKALNSNSAFPPSVSQPAGEDELNKTCYSAATDFILLASA